MQYLEFVALENQDNQHLWTSEERSHSKLVHEFGEISTQMAVSET